MAIDAGTRAARFLPQDRRYSSLASYTVSVGLCQHKGGEFEQICMLTSGESKTAAAPYGVSQLLSFLYVCSLLYVGYRPSFVVERQNSIIWTSFDRV